MAELTRLEKLRQLLEVYGTAVRAGVITPNLDDEVAIRKMIGLPDVNADVKAEWPKTKGVRSPVTLAKGVSETDAPPEQPEDQE